MLNTEEREDRALDEEKTDKEREIEKYLDELQEAARKKLGLAEIMWITIAKFFSFGQIILDVIVSFAKPSFVSQVAVALGIFYFYNPEKLRKAGFEQLTFMMGLSIIYDFVWLVLFCDYGDTDSSNDRREAFVQLFVLRVLYVSMVWRVSRINSCLTYTLGNLGPRLLQAVVKLRDSGKG